MKRYFLSIIMILTMNPVQGMDHFKETVQRMGDHSDMSGAFGSDSKHVSELAAATIATPRNIQQASLSGVDATVQSAKKRIEMTAQKEADDRKYNIFYKEFRDEADIQWKNHKKEEDEFIAQIVRKHSSEALEKNIDVIADETQKGLDKMHIDKYRELYKELYQKHYHKQPSDKVAQNAAECIYEQQKNSCCVIL